jgi:hypothetical protein
LAHGRTQVRRSGTDGYRAMLSVVEGRTEIANALRQTYSVIAKGIWSPVSQYCGGCPHHWGADRWPGRPAPPVVPRLDHFDARERYKNWISRWPMASDNLLVIDVPSDTRHASHCFAVLRALVHALTPHTLLLGPEVPFDLEQSVFQGSGQLPANWPFVEDLRSADIAGQPAGENEVRLTVWGLGTAKSVLDAVWTSRAALEILVIPDNLVHPVHPGRRLVDTTPHIHAEEIVNSLST